jgi:hypothetical protein
MRTAARRRRRAAGAHGRRHGARGAPQQPGCREATARTSAASVAGWPSNPPGAMAQEGGGAEHVYVKAGRGWRGRSVAVL